MKLPVRIISDLHLGHKASTIRDVEELRPLIAGAGTVVLNGDTWEELATPWRKRSLAMLEALKAMAEVESCELIFLRGNHDPNFTKREFIELAGGRIAIMHGDALLRYSSPWKREILTSREAVEEIWREFPRADVDRDQRLAVAAKIARDLPSKRYSKKRTFSSRVLDAISPPQRALFILHAWLYQAELGAAFCERYFPKAEVLLCGHLHCAGIREKRGRTIINSGSFVIPARAYLTEWDGEFLEIFPVGRSEEKLEISEAARVWRFV